jgi:hypothetical protein
LLRPLIFILTIAFVLLLSLLHLLLLPRPFINKESVERMVNKLLFVYSQAITATTPSLYVQLDRLSIGEVEDAV